MRTVLVTFMLFLGLMFILRSLLELIPRWRARREARRRRDEDRV